MSAIAGILHREGHSVSFRQIKKMNDILSHRGPDGSNIWIEGSIALAHQMLHTTPESLGETLPFEDLDSGLVITADARVDNRAELAPHLGLEDVKNIPDSLFILKSYIKWGEKCPEKLLGDFAFAIWDKENEQLFCARDHMGVKPFYYYLSDSSFFFSTELKAILTIPEVSSAINDEKIAFHLMKIYDKNYTFYKDIFSLTAAHSITINKDKFKLIEFWKINPDSHIILDSEEEYLNAFREIFIDSVNCRLRSAFPVGFQLSGGLDSSSIVSTAKLIYDSLNSQKEIQTFSFIFDDLKNCDESNFIKHVVDLGNINPVYVKADQIDPLENLETILWHNDQPFFSPTVSLMFKLYKKMCERSIRVSMSGLDGDSVISYGQNYLKELATTLQWRKLSNEIKEFSKHQDISSFQIFKSQIVSKLIPHYIKNLFSPNNDAHILNKNFSIKINAQHYLKTLKLIPRIKANSSKKYHHYILEPFTHQHALEMEDKLNAIFSIEPRYPFYDKRLIEFCYAIPTEMKFKSGWNRYILRKSMENILPPEVQWRVKKTDLKPFFYRNFLLFGQEKMERFLFKNNEIIGDYVDLAEIEEIYNKYNLGISSSDLINLWLVTILFQWLNNNAI